MTDCALKSYVQKLNDYDHRSFVQSLQLNESSENNLKELMKVTNYYRRVIVVHVVTCQAIHAKSVLLAKRYNSYWDVAKNVERGINGVKAKSGKMYVKLAEAQEKQLDLTHRVQLLMNRLKSEVNVTSAAEIQAKKVFGDLKNRSDVFKDSMLSVKQKVDDLTLWRDELKFNKKLYFKDRQINIMKENLCYMSDSIKDLLNDIFVIKKRLDADYVV